MSITNYYHYQSLPNRSIMSYGTPSVRKYDDYKLKVGIHDIRLFREGKYDDICNSSEQNIEN